MNYLDLAGLADTLEEFYATPRLFYCERSLPNGVPRSFDWNSGTGEHIRSSIMDGIRRAGKPHRLKPDKTSLADARGGHLVRVGIAYLPCLCCGGRIRVIE